MVQRLPSIFQILTVISTFICLSACVKQAVIPTSTSDTIKHYQRITVKTGGGWSKKTDFSISPGDFVLILASGNISTPWTPWVPPFSALFMKIGKKGQPRFAVTQPNNRRFFRSTELGQLSFRVGDPTSTNVQVYHEAYGGFLMDIFVFSKLDEQHILQALGEVVEANPKDDRLESQLRQITDRVETLTALLAAQEGQTAEIEKTGPASVFTVKGNLEGAQAIEENNRQNRTIFQAGHTDVVRSAAFSPDGRYVISGGNDRTLRLWEVSTGREIRVFRGHLDVVSCVAFEPGGRFVISGSEDTSLRLWEVTTGREIRRFEGLEGAIKAVAVSSDGKYVISGGDDQIIRLWQVSTGKQIRIFKGHEGSVNSVNFTLDSKYAISGSWDGSIQLWDVNTGKRIKRFKGNNSCINSVAFSPDGQFVLSGGDDRTLKLWRMSDGRKLKTFEGHRYQVTCVAFSPDGKYGLSGSHDNTIRLWEVATGKELRDFKGHLESIRSVTFSPDGRYALSSSNDQSLRLWEVSTGRHIIAFRGQKKSIRSVAFSPNGKFTLWGSDDNTIRLWEVASGKEIRSFEGHDGAVNAIDIGPNGKYVISGGNDGTLRLWEVSSSGEIRILKGHELPVNSVDFSPDGKYILSGGEDKTLRIWEVATGSEIRMLETLYDNTRSVAFSRDGRFVFSSSDQGFRMWEISTGREINFVGGIVKELLGSVTSAALSPDGRYVLTGSGEGDILLWEVLPDSGISLFQRFLKGHAESANTLAFSPDGKYALSGANDKTLRLWEISSGGLIKVFRGHSDSVRSVAFSPDGKFAFSGGDDCSVRLWSIESGQEVVSFHYSNDGEWILTTPDGYYACSPEGSALVYWVYAEGMETFTFEQFEHRFKRQDIIKARLSGNLDAGTPAPTITQPPHIEMADHFAIKNTSTKNYSLNLIASAMEEIKAVRVFVNGKPTLEVPVNAKEKELSLNVPLFSGANRITAVAYDEKGFSSNPCYVDVICKHAGLVKPNLYVFAVGISNYPNLSSGWQLEFAHTDAQTLIEAFQNQEGKLFGEVRYSFLSNRQANVEMITEVLDALNAVGENDLVVIFMAGHGVKTKDGTFYFLTSDGSFDEPQKGGVSWTLLGEHLSRIKGRVILLLDACHSGSIVTETVVPNDELAQQLFSGGHGGVMVFSASKGRQYSLESPDIGGGFGVFTYNLIQSLGPEARLVDINANGFVEFMEMVDYVSQKVHQVTNGEQTPWLSRKELFGDLPIAVVN